MLTNSLREVIFNDLRQGPAFSIGPGGIGMFITVHDPVTTNYDEFDSVINSIAVREAPYIIWSVAASDNVFNSDLTELNAESLMVEASELIKDWDKGFCQIVDSSIKDATSQFHFWFPNNLHPWHNERITLIGDAIHPMPPTGGLGASIAIIDAVNLVEHLEREKNPAVALSKYQLSMLNYAPRFVDEARPPLVWQQRFANNFFRKFAMSVFLPSVNTLLQFRDRIRSR